MNQHTTPSPITIVPFNDQYSEAFARLNLKWLEEYSLLEEIDQKYMDHPRETIIAKGGEIFFALRDGMVVGTCAAIPSNAEEVELAKLAVDESVQGRGLGQQLSEAVIAWARSHGARIVVLVSSTKLAAALRLYERLGFQYRELPEDSEYTTADIYMELAL